MMRSFLITFFMTVCVGLISIGPLFLYLWKVGEYLSADEIVERQSGEDDVIFGSGLRREDAYKLTALKALEPEITVLGSSRVMQFRQHSFKDKFFNLGGLMNSIHDGHVVARHLIEVKPKALIIGVDIWWFNLMYIAPKAYDNTSFERYEAKPKLADAHRFVTYLVQGNIDLSLSNHHIGLSGKKGRGFGKDGFRYYGSMFTEESGGSAKFKDTLSRIDNNNRRFEYGAIANREHLDHFKALINRFETKDIDVIVFFPPFALTVNDKMVSLGEKYAYVTDLKTQLKNMKIEFFDYTNANLIGSGDCEFIDGFHGGEITYARILKDMSKKSPLIAGALDIDTIDKLINENTGMATSTKNFPTGGSERDFLGLGCNKSRE